MFNLLIVEDDFVQAQHIVNSICKALSNVRLYNIISTAKECIDILKDEPKIDIIILDLNLPDMYGNSIIEYIEKHNIKKYENSIIIYSGYIDFINKIHLSKYIFSYRFKGSGSDMLINEVQRLIETKKIIEKDSALRKKLTFFYMIYTLILIILEQSIYQIVFIQHLLFLISIILFFKRIFILI